MQQSSSSLIAAARSRTASSSATGPDGTRQYFEFEVALRDIEPKIWRRFLLRQSVTFHQLHLAIQRVGPWQNYHLYEFCRPADDRSVIARVPSGEYEESAPDSQRLSLAHHFTEPGTTCLYRYDFGDDWEHDITFIRTHELPEDFRQRLLDGERSFPPEDCGGVPGYYECLAALGVEVPVGTGYQAPESEELEERRAWLGKWRPEWNLVAAKRTFDR